MSHSPFKLDKNMEIHMRAAEAQQRQAVAAAQRAELQRQLENGAGATDFLIAFAKKTPGGVLRISSLVRDRPGQRDCIFFGHDDETNEWTVTYGVVPDKEATSEASTEPSPSSTPVSEKPSNIIALTK